MGGAQDVVQAASGLSSWALAGYPPMAAAVAWMAWRLFYRSVSRDYHEKEAARLQASIEAGIGAREALRLEKDRRIEEGERRADGLEQSFREHLEHDARVFSGESDRRNPPRYKTGNPIVDAARAHSEAVSQSIPKDALEKVRGMIDRGEIAL